MAKKPDLNDPLERLALHQRSQKQAIGYVILIPVLTLLCALIIGILGHNAGGPYCDAGIHTYLCNDTFALLFPLVPAGIAMCGALGATIITYIKWANQNRWRPWLAVCWILIPFWMMWMTSTFSILILGVR